MTSLGDFTVLLATKYKAKLTTSQPGRQCSPRIMLGAVAKHPVTMGLHRVPGLAWAGCHSHRATRLNSQKYSRHRSPGTGKAGATRVVGWLEEWSMLGVWHGPENSLQPTRQIVFQSHCEWLHLWCVGLQTRKPPGAKHGVLKQSTLVQCLGT